MVVQDGLCPRCHKATSILRWTGDDFACPYCLKSESSSAPALIEYEQLQPNVKSSKGHIADIKSRRLDTTTGKMYYDKGSRSYFY